MEIPYTVKARPDTGLYNGKLGLWLFLASEVMLFGALFSSYVLLRVGAADGTWSMGLMDIVVERDRTALLGAHLMGVYGRLQRQVPITHFIAESVHNCDSYLGFLQSSDQRAPQLKRRDFC